MCMFICLYVYVYMCICVCISTVHLDGIQPGDENRGDDANLDVPRGDGCRDDPEYQGLRSCIHREDTEAQPGSYQIPWGVKAWQLQNLRTCRDTYTQTHIHTYISTHIIYIQLHTFTHIYTYSCLDTDI